MSANIDGSIVLILSRKEVKLMEADIEEFRSKVKNQQKAIRMCLLILTVVSYLTVVSSGTGWA